MLTRLFRKKTDTSLNTVHRIPTFATWPTRPDALSDLPADYLPCLAPWLEQGLPLARILYVPAFRSSEVVRPEYVIAWSDRALLLLIRAGSGAIEGEEIPWSAVRMVRYRRAMIDCCGEIIWEQDGTRKTSVFYYNYSTEKQFVPIFNRLLGQSDDHAEDLLNHENEACAALRDKSYVMYSFGRLAYRMDDRLRDYFWDMTEQKEKWYMSERVRNDYMAAVMGNGVAVVQYCTNNNHRRCDYIPQASFAGMTVETGKKGSALTVHTRCGEQVAFPLQQAHEETAAEFCGRWSVLK